MIGMVMDLYRRSMLMFQGTVLSAFFWGYAMTQVLGDYVSDRIGGATVLVTAAVGWAFLTFWTPRIVYMFSDKSIALSFIVLSRVLVGAFQGMFTECLYCSLKASSLHTSL